MKKIGVVCYIEVITFLLSYRMKFPFEHIDTNDGKNQPKDDANDKNIENIWQSSNQSIDHNFHSLHFRHGS